MKKQGSILIETLVSAMIVTLTATFIISTSIENSNILRERILQEEVDRAISNLENELKYNTSSEEIHEMLENKIGFKYNGDFSRELIYKNLDELEDGEDIRLNKISEDGIGLNLEIVANIKVGKNEVNVEKKFTKSWWMDEV
ncbi:hypothetical protein [Clostridium beijerinckii]|uniref:Uncharacterized protein n=1 Tax=Clostridium beijerinckii TaxID=1520 RepID=A0A9Q5CER0_CLOBE|nr:hypothetical protein [Clostridium beijerinckii]AQS04301.1 hypothetical protein CLBIJ_17200 [Clostridium beijerinckii]MBA2883806.1 hypothetical protein [Clostridium beijerinckii]MBA2898992.1 hypothetical protein [Clostridium beijerinckii]MBA2908392.1 hypothetical protein [Clostridium beijerinckii]MBA9016145.1 hypothetical protein [Clostridium beijerinckii]